MIQPNEKGRSDAQRTNGGSGLRRPCPPAGISPRYSARTPKTRPSDAVSGWRKRWRVGTMARASASFGNWAAFTFIQRHQPGRPAYGGPAGGRRHQRHKGDGKRNAQTHGRPLRPSRPIPPSSVEAARKVDIIRAAYYAAKDLIRSSPGHGQIHRRRQRVIIANSEGLFVARAHAGSSGRHGRGRRRHGKSERLGRSGRTAGL
jgi:hypothetical protein